MEDLYTVHQLANLLCLASTTVREYARDGKLPEPIRLGGGPKGSLRWRRAVINAWLAAGCPDPTTWKMPAPKSTEA